MKIAVLIATSKPDLIMSSRFLFLRLRVPIRPLSSVLSGSPIEDNSPMILPAPFIASLKSIVEGMNLGRSVKLNFLSAKEASKASPARIVNSINSLVSFTLLIVSPVICGLP